MSIKSELNSLKESDIWSLLLFSMYKLRDIPECSTLSELAFVLDKPNLLKLCEYFGGLTISIPTIEDLEIMLCALVMYSSIDINHESENVALAKLPSNANVRKIKTYYRNLQTILSNYSFQSRDV